MKMSGNTILITGGGSGIGLALAEEFKKLDNQVIVAGRSRSKLEEASKKGFPVLEVDMMSAESIRKMAHEAIQKYPSLNVVIHNAGIMRSEDLIQGGNAQTQDETVATNFLGPMRLTDALLPHFLKQKSAAIMTVTSGLAFLPLNLNPTYCATKAAIHSYTESLRYQLKDTPVEVLELAPPYVQTHLTGDRQANDPMAMPLKEFIAEVMDLLKTPQLGGEILVKRVHMQRQSGYKGAENYQAVFKQINDMLTAARKAK